jgi:hemoglobin
MQPFHEQAAGPAGQASARREPLWPFVTPLLAVLIIGCAGFPAGGGGSLYARLGGLTQIEMIVDETVNLAAADPRIRRTFEATRLPALKENMSAQVCVLSGGPCRHDAETIRKARGGPRISDGEFEVFVGSMRVVLERRVSEREKNEMLRLLAPMKREIVGA